MTERAYLICEWDDAESGGLCVYDAPTSVLNDMDALNIVLSQISFDYSKVVYITKQLIPIGDNTPVNLEDEIQTLINRKMESLKKHIQWMDEIPYRIADGYFRFTEEEHAKKFSLWLGVIRREGNEIVRLKRYMKSIS